jgi:hypothetical protein
MAWLTKGAVRPARQEKMINGMSESIIEILIAHANGGKK